MIHADPTTWPLDELLDEIAAMRSLRDQLADAGCPPHSLESADAEIARLVAAARRCEACGHRDLEPGRPGCRLLVLGAAYLQSSVAGWLAAPATPNQCAHFATGGTPG